MCVRIHFCFQIRVCYYVHHLAISLTPIVRQYAYKSMMLTRKGAVSLEALDLAFWTSCNFEFVLYK